MAHSRSFTTERPAPGRHDRAAAAPTVPVAESRGDGPAVDVAVDFESLEQAMDRLEASAVRVSGAQLETLRESVVRSLDAGLPTFADGGFPLGVQRLRLLLQGSRLLARLRERYAGLRPALERRGAGSPGGRAPDDSIESWLPTLRALDAQSRLLRAKLSHRVAAVADDWRTLAGLAAQARASTFLDSPVPDDCAIMGTNTARALFALPLLLHLADLESRTVAQARAIDRLARQCAARVGFRIDREGDLMPNPHGPTLVVDDELAIRLDTHALARLLADKLRLLDEPSASRVRLPRGIDAAQLRRLLSDLQRCWTATQPPRRPQGIGAPRVALRVGMPPAAGGDGPGYDFGRFEHNTLIRDARARVNSVAPIPEWLGVHEWAQVVGWNAGPQQIDAWLTRHERGSLELGSLVLMRAQSDRAALPLALAARDAVWAGQLVAMGERLGDGDRLTARQQLRLRLWPMPATVVEVRLAIGGDWLRAPWLPALPDSDSRTSLVLRPGMAAAARTVMLRLPDREVSASVGDVVERGHLFERVMLDLG